MKLAGMIKLRKCFAGVLLFSLICTFMLQFNVQSARAGSKTIVVPEEYTTIGEAVANASPGDMVFVKSGVYHENVLIDKPLLVKGEASANTLIIGEGAVNNGNVLTLASDNVTVTGFTIKSEEYATAKQHANGVNIRGDDCTVWGNNIVDSFWGVLCPIQSYTVITGNNITGNLKEGIRF